MLHAEVLDALARQKDSALLFDRRIEAATPRAEFNIETTWTLGESGSSKKVHVSLLHFPASSSIPLEIRTQRGGRFLRRMDRFFIPEIPDLAITCALFDLISSFYEALVSTEDNIETAFSLLEKVTRDATDGQRILDFGCGTGLAMNAMARLEKKPRLIGTDLSQRMLEFASKRGETTIPLAEWRLSSETFQGAIACFVLHYGVPEGDLALIAQRLEPGARFAANFFKASAQQIGHLIQFLQLHGLTLEEAPQQPSASSDKNTLLIFKKNHR